MSLRFSSRTVFANASSLCAVGLLCALAAPAPAQGSDTSSARAPIRVTGCGAGEGRKPTAHSRGTSTLDVEYEDLSSKRIVRIEWGFTVNDKIVARVTDTSALAPQATADHHYPLNYDIFPQGLLLGDMECHALSVKLADGTLWTGPRPAMPLRAVATPPPGEDLAMHMQPSGAQIAMSSCSLSVDENHTPVTSTVEIAYTNTAAQPTSRVDWGLAAEGTIYEKFADMAPVAPNVSVDRRWKLPGNLLQMSRPPGAPPLDANCFVLHVRYADGTQWPPARN
ncbi:MAG: hypothetical protein ACYDDQ_10930 [Vulcanimicrobiaceae bacterium]